ncbi:MAG: serine/threonine protein kinase [Pleurocapsa sp.]
MKSATIQQKYKIIKVLRQDSLTETFLAQETGLYSLKRYVIKKFRPILCHPQAKAIKDLFYQEANTLKLLKGKNPQIPQLDDYFMDGEDFYLVREWIEGITLEQKVQQEGKLSETEVIKILDGILSVLEYIHGCGLVYGELSPSSIVLRQNNDWWQTRKKDNLPVLIYFSGVKTTQPKNQRLSQRSLVLANPQEYVSPEQEKGDSAFESDFYSLGLTAIYLLTGKTPAELDVHPHTNQLLWHQETNDITSNLIRVIDRAIYPNISDRRNGSQHRFTSAQEMRNALFPQSITISESLITQPEPKSKLTPEVKIVTALFCFGFGVMGIAVAMLNLDFKDFQHIEAQQDTVGFTQEDEPVISAESSSDSSFEAVAPQATLNIPVFRVGTPQEQLIGSLGQPTYESRGYWGYSRAFLYKDFAQQGVDLGYLSDVATQTVLQTEMSFAESIKEVEVQKVLKQLLMSEYSVEIEQKIEQVINQKSDKQEFSVNNLKGIIQRNAQNRVYVGVWEADFHQ